MHISSGTHLGAGEYARSRWVPRRCTTVASVGHMTNCPRNTEQRCEDTEVHSRTNGINKHACWRRCGDSSCQDAILQVHYSRAFRVKKIGPDEREHATSHKRGKSALNLRCKSRDVSAPRHTYGASACALSFARAHTRAILFMRTYIVSRTQYHTHRERQTQEWRKSPWQQRLEAQRAPNMS